MKTFILIFIMSGQNSANIKMQEFNSLEQCQYAAQLIKKSIHRPADIYCIYK